VNGIVGSVQQVAVVAEDGDGLWVVIVGVHDIVSLAGKA